MSRKREGSLQTSASRKPRYDEIIMIDSSDDEQVVPRVGDDECVILEDKYIPPNPDLQVATLVLDSQEVPGSSKGKAPKKTPDVLACPLCGEQFELGVVQVHAAQCDGRPTEEAPQSSNLDQEKPSTSKHQDLPKPVEKVKTKSVQIQPAQLPPSIPKPVGDDLLPCPLCGEQFDLVALQVHAAQCDGEPLEKVACPLCEEQFELGVLQVHAAECTGKPAKTEEAPHSSTWDLGKPSTSKAPIFMANPPVVIQPVKKVMKKKAPEDVYKRNEKKITEITKHVGDDVPLADLGTVHSLDSPSPNHAFYNSQNHHSHAFFKIYKAEIKRLRTSMPKGIHLWTYESRLDLLSFAIEGPTGTPYEHCLFFFDAVFPEGYPFTTPPKVHYRAAVGDARSMDKRINPNLYTNGKVCLSLLGTWSGSGCEKWNHKSNLLQVVVSLQGLTLNAEPYFNEPAYEALRNTTNGINNSKAYNCKLTELLCDHVITTIRNPGAPFEDLVKEFYFGSSKQNMDKFIQKIQNLTTERPDDLPYHLLPFPNSWKAHLRAKLPGKLHTLTIIKSQQDR